MSSSTDGSANRMAEAPMNRLGASHHERVDVVIVTRNRGSDLLTTLDHLRRLPEEPRVIVVDNGSTDATCALVRAQHPDVDLVALRENAGAAARTIGVEHTHAPYVAFSDDDSWWEPGSLAAAAEIFARFPRLAVIAARVLVGECATIDPTCEIMAESPLPARRPLPGPPVLGFIACGAIVRRDAYLEVGGFHREFGIGGEEQLLALDLVSAGWDLAYVDSLVAYHHPSPVRDPERRRVMVTRNALWSAWLRLSARAAARHTWETAVRLRSDRAVRAAFLAALQGVPWVLRERRPLAPSIEADFELLPGA
jgi:N-acetylglucosaminyl-diphospho-decaprenol L-rhamnosyltransferase